MGDSADHAAKTEADRTFLRGIELDLRPVAGKFDIHHLQQIHQRLFQDLPAFKPGRLRQPTPEGRDWVKRRAIEGNRFLVAYSPLNAKALHELGAAMDAHSSRILRGVAAAAMPVALAKLYSAIDYAHPFNDGNSRSLRIFTRQLAKAAGYTLNWEALGHDSFAQARLYVARDLAVNALALPNVRSDSNRRDAQFALDVLAQNPSLEELLKKAIT